MNQQERRQYLIDYLIRENSELEISGIPKDEQSQKQLLRALMNIRLPHSIDSEFLEIQDAYLKQELEEKGITKLNDLSEIEKDIYLWQGDITTLEVDGIVNAANKQMTGCYYPNHGCIDNAIHTFSGVQLRNYCNELMNEQGHDEETGQAKITPAFNLPSDYVIHTVGPIILSKVAQKDIDDLISCYYKSLELADQHHLDSLAFCCISTGEFRFPNKLAAQIAIETVKRYKKETESPIKVVFNVFKDEDKEIYERLLKEN